MKLRLNANSLRLRISRSELARFLSGGRIKETVHFTAAPDARLTYALELALQVVPVRVQYEPREVTVLLSEEQSRIWSAESEVGVYATIDNGAAGSLDVIIEKDFACLDRSDAENTDTFANPHAGAVC